MEDLNSVAIIGRLAKEPTLSKTGAGVPVSNFTLITNNRGNGNLSFIPVCVFGEMAERCAKYLLKGSEVVVSGALQTKTDKKQNSYIEIVACYVKYLTGPRTTRTETTEYSEQKEALKAHEKYLKQINK